MQEEDKYFFILGRNPEISLAEILAVLPQKVQILKVSHSFLIVNAKINDPKKLIKRLGGTIKIGKILGQSQNDLFSQDFEKDLLTKILPLAKNFSHKFFFGFSFYFTKPLSQPFRKFLQFSLSFKKILSQNERKVRLVTSKNLDLSSVIVQKNHLLDRGFEICFFLDQKDVYLGRTLAVQEFAEASFRDFSRPWHQMSRGILPLQLAKILINLAQIPENAFLLDPFCGFGTILTEALLMNYKNIFGADKDPEAVLATRENLRWLVQKFSLPALFEDKQIQQCEVEKLSQCFPFLFQAIITEPYLGPLRYRKNELLNIGSSLKELYLKAFQEFRKILTPQGKVVFIFPVFKQDKKILKISSLLLPELSKLGFQAKPLIPKPIGCFKKSISLIYKRPDQKIWREIFVFLKPQP